jgi:sugar phosphate isomerase/epimerase
MHNFGFKVADRHPHLLDPILEYAVRHDRPIEVGLYFGDPEALELLERRLIGTTIPINAHTNHERFHAFNLHHTEALLDEHIRVARAFGSDYSVLHTADQPMSPRASRRAALMSLLLDNLERAEALCAAHDYRLHLENVYHPIPFYRELFEGIRVRGLRRIHFCFDIGHAKVWSGETLEEWIDFLDDLRATGFLLHCHLHANRGLADEHLSMAEVDAMGIGGPDGYYNEHGYPAAFWLVEQRQPEAVKIFEVRPELAIANMEAVSAARPLRPASAPERGGAPGKVRRLARPGKRGLG